MVVVVVVVVIIIIEIIVVVILGIRNPLHLWPTSQHPEEHAIEEGVAR